LIFTPAANEQRANLDCARGARRSDLLFQKRFQSNGIVVFHIALAQNKSNIPVASRSQQSLPGFGVFLEFRR